MATIIIDDTSTPQAKQFFEASKECEAVPVSSFIGELRRQVDEHFEENAGGRYF